MRMWFLSKYLCNCDEHELSGWRDKVAMSEIILSLSFRVHIDKVGVYDFAIRV